LDGLETNAEKTNVMCELLGMSSNRMATLSLSLMKLADHGGNTGAKAGSCRSREGRSEKLDGPLLQLVLIGARLCHDVHQFH
jgi:hypothetical protein